MNLVFDTSVLIDVERNRTETINRLDELRKEYPAPAKISFISYFEFIYGLRNKSIKNKAESKSFIEIFDVINTTKNTANMLVSLKQKYELPLSDLFIAAQVMETKGILVTKDKDFEKIDEIDKILI